MITPVNDTLSLTDVADRRYWLRAHQRAVTRCRRRSASYEHAWRSGHSAWQEWKQLRAADRRERYCYTILCRVMDWR
jgi:hypothetical protein